MENSLGHTGITPTQPDETSIQGCEVLGGRPNELRDMRVDDCFLPFTFNTHSHGSSGGYNRSIDPMSVSTLQELRYLARGLFFFREHARQLTPNRCYLRSTHLSTVGEGISVLSRANSLSLS